MSLRSKHNVEKLATKRRLCDPLEHLEFNFMTEATNKVEAEDVYDDEEDATTLYILISLREKYNCNDSVNNSTR